VSDSDVNIQVSGSRQCDVAGCWNWKVSVPFVTWIDEWSIPCEHRVWCQPLSWRQWWHCYWTSPAGL